eukprot:TRINITY_DN16779_c0_g1_i3.p1 TRINITY_DN16779_c0_g1~~TRINITY_DN16779_c0_g1_i3.p1  ORF type:complete len:509 (+),score=185.19 TRINITY_DN16779_c0_g1_i3:46-1572(+)
MPFGDLLKAAQTALGTVGEAVGGVVGGPEEGLLSPVTRDVVLVRPPADNIVAASLGRGAEWVKTRIQKEFRGYNCLLVDLTGEAGSLAVLHEGPVACFSCKEATPTLQMLWSFVAAVTEHLARPNSRVLVLLDGPGEGRAALCVICFMLYTSLFVDEKKAVAWYRGKRKDPVHFTPSQLRYLSYFSRGMSARQMFTPPPQVPALVRLITLRGVPVSVLSRPRVVLELEHVRAVYANGNAFSNRARVAKSVVYTPGEAGVVRRRGSVSTSPAGIQTETVELIVNTYVEDDFNVTMWSVNEFRRREVLFNLQMHSSHLFPDAVQNGAVLTFPAAQMDSVAGCMGSALAVDVDVVCERRRDPFTTDDGSIVIVHKEQAPEPTGVRPSVSVSDMALLPRPASPASFGASTIACIPPEDLLLSVDPFTPREANLCSSTLTRSKCTRARRGHDGIWAGTPLSPPHGMRRNQSAQLLEKVPTQGMKSCASYASLPRVPSQTLFQSCLSSVDHHAL